MKDWHKVLLAVVAAAIAAWKLRAHKEELKDLHNELIKAKDDAADSSADLSFSNKLSQPASVRKRTILLRAGALAERLAGESD